jgi:peptidyl-dipeptidase Dcp
MKKISLSVLLILFSVSMIQAKNPLLSKYNTPRETIPFDEIKLNHYEPAFEEAMKMHDREIRNIVENKTKPTFQNTIEALEYSGELLSKVSSTFFNMLSAESSDEMMAIAQRIQPKMTEHANNITLNNDLFRRVKTVYDEYQSSTPPQPLTREQQRLLQQTYERFVDNGAALSREDQEKYRILSTQLSAYTLNFGQTP